MCGIILHLFLSNLKKIIEISQLPMDLCISLLNNKYQKMIKNLIKKVYKKLKSKIPLKFLKIVINEGFLIKMINRIEEVLYEKIIKFLKSEIKKKMLERPDFIDL